MNSSGRLLGFLAGFAMAFAGYAFFAYVTNLSAWNLANEPSYVGGITVAPEAGLIAEPMPEVYCASGSWDCDRSAITPYLGFLALIAIALAAGAAAARIGEPASALRSGSAVFAGALGFGAWGMAASGHAAFKWPEALAWVLFAMAAGILGSAGGALVKKLR